MIQKGTVIKTDQHRALVAIPRSSACGEHCASCSGGCQAKGHVVWIENPISAKKGDRVLLTAPTASVLFGSLVVYMLPLIIFFIGYGVTYSLSKNSAWSVLASLVALSGSFYLLHLLDKKIAPKTRITEILNPDDSGKDERNGI